jgi:NADP-dependent 3-hydroxy acid dehydrogenase YdfG
MSRGTAVVTGASSGIGAATARRLAAEGFDVVAAARRRERLDQLAAETPGVRAVTLDVTSPESVAELAASLEDVAVLVNNAGGAIGVEPIERAHPEDWQAMFDTNVLGVLRVTQALLPALERGAGGHVVVTGSIAGHLVYEGGGGYTAAKHGAAAFVETLRLELNGRPVRVTEVAPGMVRTEEFSLVRLRVRRGGRTAHSRGHRRLHRVRGHPAGARQRGPARGQAAGAGRAAQGFPRLRYITFGIRRLCTAIAQAARARWPRTCATT